MIMVLPFFVVFFFVLLFSAGFKWSQGSKNILSVSDDGLSLRQRESKLVGNVVGVGSPGIKSFLLNWFGIGDESPKFKIRWPENFEVSVGSRENSEPEGVSVVE
ncbi:hypothetical protein V8G54_000665 [Vigna mungo]|uniref:Uncharacterized protein n=1 Tax=Vigna mungo TaxID=3915 RepID=A0AAQ3P503_VIGMU